MNAKYDYHGMCRHPIYHTYCCMKQRCYYPRDKCYHLYGGRGITVCDEWMECFKNFLDWANVNGWQKGLQLDRIEVNGNYEPSNCRFVTVQVNALNKRNTVRLTFNGETKTMKDWSEELGLSIPTIKGRLAKRWPVDKILSTKKLVRINNVCIHGHAIEGDNSILLKNGKTSCKACHRRSSKFYKNKEKLFFTQ